MGHKRLLTMTVATALGLLPQSGWGQDENAPNENDVQAVVQQMAKDMVSVKGGTFLMGASDGWGYDDERPVHEVTLSSFMISKYEVTQQLWTLIMGENPSTFQGDSLPVNNVSWDECQLFISKLNEISGRTFRLPTEAEWEFAARGGVKGKDLGEGNGYQYSGGYSDKESMSAYVWYADNSDSITHKIGTKKPNELGLYDMSGNVCEYVQDFFSEFSYTEEPQLNPTCVDSCENRVYRGGSYERPAWQCRLASRYGIDPAEKREECGLRLVMNALTSTAKVLVVTTTDGTQTRFVLNEIPFVTIEKPYLVVKSAQAEISFALEQMLNIKYENAPEEPSAIKPIADDRLHGNERINFSNLPADASVKVYTLDGKLIYAHQPSSGNTFALPLSSLQKGLNLVKVNGVTYKVIRP